MITSKKSSKRPIMCISFIALSGVITVLAFSVALIVYSSTKLEQIKPLPQASDYLALNLNSHPILELTTASSADLCPAQTEAINLGQWTGTSLGCLKPDGSVYTTEDTCDDSDNTSDDNDIKTAPVSSVNMYEWEGSVFCAKRAQLGTDYVQAVNCPTGFRSCSPGICLLNSLSCPITSVTFGSGSDPNYRVGTSSNYIISSRVLGDSPLIHLSISLNSIPCFGSREQPTGNGDYALLVDRPRGCTYGVDSDFSYEIARMTQEQVFQYNSFPSEVYSLPGYRTILQGAQSVLAGRKRITMANEDQCLRFEPSFLIETRDAVGTSHELFYYAQATSFAAAALYTIFCLFGFFGIVLDKGYSSCKNLILDRTKSWIPAWRMFYVFFGFSQMVIIIVMGALTFPLIYQITSIQAYTVLPELNDFGCFPAGAPMEVVTDYEDFVNKGTHVVHALISTLTALFALSLFAYCMVMYKRRFNTDT